MFGSDLVGTTLAFAPSIHLPSFIVIGYLTAMALRLKQTIQISTLTSGVVGLLCLISTGLLADTLEQINVFGAEENLTPASTGEVVEQEHSGFTSHINLNTEQSAGGQTLADIIAREAGSQVRSSGGLGSYSEISLRGASSEQVMIYLDGLLLNEGSGGGVDLSLIDLSQLANIDIYRGSTPVQLGGASFGGAVNLITPKARKGQQASISATAGSFGTQKLNVRMSGQKERLDGLIALGLSQADNDFTFNNDNGTQYNPLDDRKEGRNNAEVSQHSALLKMGWQQSDSNRADMQVRLMQKNQGLPSWNNHKNTDTSFDTKSYQLRGKITSDGHFNGALNTSLEAYYSNKNELYDDRNSDIGLGYQYDENITLTGGLKHYMEWISDSSTTSLTTDLRQENYDRDDRLDYQVDDSSKRDSLSIGVQHNRFLAEDRLLITPSLRYQHYNHEMDTDDAGHNAQSTSHTSPNIGLSYTLNQSLTVKTNAGRYVREPAFYELFGDRGFFLGNDELIAETGTNVDLGLIWQPKLNSKILHSSKTQVSVWNNSIDNMITRTYDSRGVGKAQNIASARISGLELDTRWVFHNRVALAINFTFQNPENQSAKAAFHNKMLPGRAGQSLFASVDWPLGPWSLRYELDARYNLYYDTTNLLKAKNRQLHNLRLSRDFGQQLNAVLELNNVTDQQYEDFNGYPKPGRAAYITINYNFNTSEAP